MAKYETKDLRNIALCGQGHAGKTMLAEAMLLKAGAISRLGKIADGTTASDFDPEEKARKHSLSPTLLHCSYAGKEFNIIDTPGGGDFFGGQISGITGADVAVICVNATKGIEINARKAWDWAGQLGRARMIVVTHADCENVFYPEVRDNIIKAFGKKVVPFVVVEGSGLQLKAVHCAFSDKVPAELQAEAEALRQAIKEDAVEADDAMMEKYLTEGDITQDELLHDMFPAMVKGTIVPLFVTAAEKGIGIKEFMDGLAEDAPSPLEFPVKAIEGEAEKLVKSDANAPLLAQVFKVVSEPHLGKLCHVRIYCGKLEAKGHITLASTGKEEKLAHLFRVNGAAHEDIPLGVAGDIVTIAKVDSLACGEVITAANSTLKLPAIPFPTPMQGLALVPKARGDEQKIGASLQRLVEEDTTYSFIHDPQTKELVVRGLGQVHLDVLLARLKHRFNIEVTTHVPHIPYLETIGQKADGHYRHKKQSGGSGQFAEIYIHIRPNTRGKGLEYIDSIVGGAVSKPFVASAEKGVKAAMEKGPLVGSPVVDVVVEIYDGKMHPVDSKDIAFQTAGKFAFYEAMEKAKPVLLEPIVHLESFFPANKFGDISADISGRRGHPTGTDTLGDMMVFRAQVPLAEMGDYGSALKSITAGAGFFNMEFSHYEVVPAAVAQHVIAKAKVVIEKPE